MLPEGRALVYRPAGAELDRLPFSIRVLLENALRHVGRGIVTQAHVDALARWNPADHARSKGGARTFT